MNADTLLVAGFDAGQTHTSCRLAEDRGSAPAAVLATGEGPGVCHLAAPDGERRFADALRQSLGACLNQLPQPPSGALRLAAAAIGASGIETDSALATRAQQLAAEVLQLPSAMVGVSGDELTALEGARGHHSAGILLISGTGCIALGRHNSGRRHRCGGWGWLLDGAGSAMDIGRDALALSLQMADGRCPDSPLRAALWDALGLAVGAADAAQAIKALVVQPDFGAAGFARLAPVVHQQAQAGDRQAAAIVQRSADALVAMVTAVATNLELEAPAVWPSGGALTHLPLLRQGLQQGLARQWPLAHLAEPAGDACDGALQLASARLQAAFRPH